LTLESTLPPKTSARAEKARPDPVSEPEKRRAILHAAVRVFAERGYHGCRIADVAKEARVAYGLVYHYFKNKDALLESVFAEQWSIFIRAIESISEGPGCATEHLSGVCSFAIDAFKLAPAAVRVLVLEVARTPNAIKEKRTRQSFETAVRLVAGVVKRGQDAGEIRPELDPMVAAACLMGSIEICLTGMVVGTLGNPKSNGPHAKEEAIEAVKHDLLEVALRGLTVSAAPVLAEGSDKWSDTKSKAARRA
jgi:TetR/AcrR family fatty acid metabolism transcriptional regulator